MIQILHGDALEKIKLIKDKSVDLIVTSPPYWQLRDYGVVGQLGLEDTVEEYIKKLLDIFDECWRALKDTGTVFINMGDTYSSSKYTSIRRKSRMMIPEKIAIAMIEKGWILRNEIIWHKPNVVPEAVQDRFTNDFEKIYFFTKSEKYFFEKQYEDLGARKSRSC